MNAKKSGKHADLGSFDINKWLTLSAYVLGRNDSRDRLCFEILHLALREIAWGLMFDIHLETALKELAGSISRLDTPSLKEAIKNIVQTAEKRARVPDIVKTKMVWKPHLAVELKRAKAMEQLNEKILKPVGLMLVLHYNNQDLDQEHPIAATIERRE